jgi:hypothetical protein
MWFKINHWLNLTYSTDAFRYYAKLAKKDTGEAILSEIL